MHTIEPARVKPGVDAGSLQDEAGAGPAGAVAGERRLVRGKALIFWDRMSLPGTKFARKLDAIDTDQITPAADCVSESLDTLDERWKAGSFRYLMPDFRERVHRGDTFLIAGDRFAIGSSREMSPAGLKGVAEEAGLPTRRTATRSASILPRASCATRPRARSISRCRYRRRKRRSAAAAASSPSAAASFAPRSPRVRRSTGPAPRTRAGCPPPSRSSTLTASTSS
jgi:hypothetical protein